MSKETLLNMKLQIGNKLINATVPKDPMKGLLGTTSIGKEEGMLFSFPEGKSHITMKGMKYPLDLIGIDNGRVTSVTKADIGKEYKGKDKLILEVMRNSGIKVGDKVTKSITKNRKGGLLILDNKANVQKEISDGARIFSRIHTNQLFDKAKKISSLSKGGKIEPLYEELAELFFKFIDKQDKQKPEYV